MCQNPKYGELGGVREADSSETIALFRARVFTQSLPQVGTDSPGTERAKNGKLKTVFLEFGMIRPVRWLVCFAVFAATLFANPLTSARISTNSADELATLIARIEARYGPMRGLAADFEQTYNGAGVREKRERGRLFLLRPRRMRWEYDPKPGKLFIVNSRDVWLYVPADGEAVRADAAKVSDARFPFLFLLGQKNLRSQFSRIGFASEDAGAASGVRTLSLVPKQKDAGIREIALEVTNDGQILKVKIVEESGGVSEVWLKNVRENYVAPADAFEFRAPPGVNVRRQS